MNDDLTTRLSRQLHEQVDDWHAAPLTLDGVRGRARSIQRTRRIVTGTVAAAVVAVIVPRSRCSALTWAPTARSRRQARRRPG